MDSAILVETMEFAFTYFEYASDGQSVNQLRPRTKYSSELVGRPSAPPPLSQLGNLIGGLGGGGFGAISGLVRSGAVANIIGGLSDPAKAQALVSSGGRLIGSAVSSIGSLFRR